VVWVSANQAGMFGSLRFVGSAKIVDPGGDVLASTGTAAGLAVAELDVAAALDEARRAMAHLRDRRPQAYASGASDLAAPAGNGRAADGKPVAAA
jgi:predicted amidohydrolase